MNCKICLRSNVTRNGGRWGLCWVHKRRRCAVCRAVSAGEELCARCACGADIQRWKARANFGAAVQDVETFEVGLSRERLYQSKFHFHEAVEVFFRGIILAAEGLRGGVALDDGGGETREAA